MLNLVLLLAFLTESNIEVTVLLYRIQDEQRLPKRSGILHQTSSFLSLQLQALLPDRNVFPTCFAPLLRFLIFEIEAVERDVLNDYEGE